MTAIYAALLLYTKGRKVTSESILSILDAAGIAISPALVDIARHVVEANLAAILLARQAKIAQALGGGEDGHEKSPPPESPPPYPGLPGPGGGAAGVAAIVIKEKTPEGSDDEDVTWAGSGSKTVKDKRVRSEVTR